MVKPILVLALAGATLALVACASQPQPASHANQPKTTAQNQQTRKVCVSGTPLGSHIPQTQCVTMTVTQYKAYKKQKKEAEAQERRDLQRQEQHAQRQACGATTEC